MSKAVPAVAFFDLIRAAQAGFDGVPAEAARNGTARG
jgi:hypothetical protein